MSNLSGYFGHILEVDLSTGTSRKRKVDEADYINFIGGRGLGIKLLWDELKKPGIDALSPENPLLFMVGPFSGFPFPSASRTCVVTKSPVTYAKNSNYKNASTVSYSNMGGFFGPEIRFAGYDSIMIKGKAKKPVYIVIEDDEVKIKDATKFWGMGTDKFDKEFIKELGDRRFRTCYIGPAGENLVPYACILNTSARSAGRGGTGCVMGSKNLKAIAIKGNRQPDVAQHKLFLEMLAKARSNFNKDNQMVKEWRELGTGNALIWASDIGAQAVKNFREGTWEHSDKIAGVTSRQEVWKRDFACFCCPLSCKKSGIAPNGPYAGMVHDGPEYETGTMLGANLLIDDLSAVLKNIWHADDLGLDIISVGNVIGFLMEAYDKKLIDINFLDGIDLKWGNTEAVIKMLHKIARQEGIGKLAAQGVHRLAEQIGKDSYKFAIHVKGHTLAAWNAHYRPTQSICYATSNRGACHLNGHGPGGQNNTALVDSTGLCLFAQGGYGDNLVPDILEAINFRKWTAQDYQRAGERIFNLEKAFNYREGFRREDDSIPDRFFEEPLTDGPRKGAVLKRDEFEKNLTNFYNQRGWDEKTSRPKDEKLKELNLEFVKL